LAHCLQVIHSQGKKDVFISVVEKARLEGKIGAEE
jgi:hypothetical protein